MRPQGVKVAFLYLIKVNINHNVALKATSLAQRTRLSHVMYSISMRKVFEGYVEQVLAIINRLDSFTTRGGQCARRAPPLYTRPARILRGY